MQRVSPPPRTPGSPPNKALFCIEKTNLSEGAWPIGEPSPLLVCVGGQHLHHDPSPLTGVSRFSFPQLKWGLALGPCPPYNWGGTWTETPQTLQPQAVDCHGAPPCYPLTPSCRVTTAQPLRTRGEPPPCSVPPNITWAPPSSACPIYIYVQTPMDYPPPPRLAQLGECWGGRDCGGPHVTGCSRGSRWTL